ncbi:MAG: TAT-variant-translocated molybdopterin oxidoreductase [Acidobacteriota bacterium]
MTEKMDVPDTPTPHKASTLNTAREGSAATNQRPSAWRSLEELASTPEFESTLTREFPRQAAELGSVDRRRFLQLSGASLGLAGLTACTKQPPEKVVPYVRQPEDIVPGKPLYFATAVESFGFAAPVLAESHMGRPTKIEGNPDHPGSLGSTSATTQASILDLYDPDRLQAITHLTQIRTQPAFLQQAAGLRSALLPLGGAGLAILTGTVTSPTLARLLGDLLEDMPQARWYQHEPTSSASLVAAVDRAAGGPATLRYDFNKADVILAVDSDFLHDGAASIRHGQDFGARRKAYGDVGPDNVSRLYSVETAPSSTSTVADHRLALKPTEVGHFLVALAAQLGVPGVQSGPTFEGDEAAWVEEVALDLRAHAGRSIVVVGEWADEEMHTLALAINGALENLDSTVFATESVEVRTPTEEHTLADLLSAVERDEISTLVLLDANPVYSAPADLDVAAAIDQIPLRIYCGSHLNETAERCHWILPKSHALESWGDLRAFDGTATLIQPIVNRLYDSMSPIEVVGALLGLEADGDKLVRETWRTELAETGAWRRALHDGMVPDSGAARLALAAPDASAAAATLAGRAAGELELIFRPDPTVFDGRYANNGWLQELPKPITRLTWDNALLLSPSTARSVGFDDLYFHDDARRKAQRARLTVGDRELDLPIWVTPGIADGSLLLHLGYGRRLGGNLAMGAGFDANEVRTLEHLWNATEGVAVRPIGGTYVLACTQDHFSMEGRDLAMTTTVQQMQATPDNPLGIHLHVDPKKSMMDNAKWEYDTYAWGLSIDLSACSGCGACMIACQSENNIPVVGKDQVSRGREMHWVRVDRYFVGDDPNTVEAIINQPVPCMQCEQAPCEVVCPVAATVHSDEGLNDMVYNRCVGTRYCSNNCPYKVRRFNFLLYQDFDTPQLKLGRNPDVTVRSRGVMEKCTYCVQRINAARHEAKRERRKIRDGDIRAACEQACPGDAMVFGDLNDPNSRVSKAKKSNLDYSLLAELGVRPRTTYLGRVMNPNPQLWARLYPDRPLVEEHHGDHGSGYGDHGKSHGSNGHGASEAGH